MKEMATKQPESVIANLMGIDDQPPHPKPLCKYRRVLSESYIRKSASVGLRHGSSVFIRRSSRMYDEMSPAVKSVPGVQMSKNKHDFSFEKCSNSTTSKIKMGIRSQETGCASVSELSSGASGKGKDYASRYVLSYPQKLEYDSVPVHLIRLEKTKPDLFSTGISVFGQNSVKESDDIGDFKLELHSKSGGREHKQSSRPESGKLHHELTYRKRVVKSILSPGRSCVAQNEMLNIISQQVRLGRNSGDLSRPGYVDKNYLRSKPVSLFSKKLDESTLRYYKLKNQKIIEEEIFEPMKGRGLEQFQFSPGVSSKTSESSSSCFSCSDSENNKPQAKVHGIQDEMGDGCIETELSQCVLKSTNSNPASGYAFEDTLANSEAFNIDGIRADQQSESNPVNLSMEDGHSSYYVQEALSGEVSLKEISNKKSDYLNFSNIGQSQFQDYFEETNQQSPNSVLEPFDSQNPSTIECFKSLLLQLQDLDFESVETCYEGSVIMSDDDDSTEGFLDISRNDNAIQWWSGDIESRNFSYMVDVLDEAGFYSKKSFTDFKTWNSLEFPICPLVFKSLEKKYGKQTYWLKSERHLLFDCINSALLNILNPIINFQACEISVQKWFSSAWRRDKVEDELWNLLMNESKEENGNLSEKAVVRGIKWLELEEDIGIICRELENCLFDELVMELGTLWD